VRFEFFQLRPTGEIKTDHLERSLRWRAAGVNQNQQAGNDRQVRVNLDAVLLGAQQMTATEQPLEHPAP